MAGLVTGIVGLGISAGTTAVSFIQANNEKRNKQTTRRMLQKH
jgi:hypothetical protein